MLAPASHRLPSHEPIYNGHFTFGWTISHTESGHFMFDLDCEFDCEYIAGHVHILGGRLSDGGKLEFEAIKDGNLERFIAMKLIEIEADQNFQRRAVECWESQQ